MGCQTFQKPFIAKERRGEIRRRRKRCQTFCRVCDGGEEGGGLKVCRAALARPRRKQEQAGGRVGGGSGSSSGAVQVGRAMLDRAKGVYKNANKAVWITFDG